MKKTTRSRLLEYIRVKKQVSAAELARVFKVSAADARHHLATLEDEGVVAIVATRVHGRGRPTQIYRLTEDIHRHHLDGLASAILSVWLSTVGETENEITLKKIAAFLTASYTRPAGNMTQKLAYTVRCLNEMSYQARWEAHVAAPRVHIQHCPYLRLVAGHPEICQIDEYVIGNLLGSPVRRVAPLSIDAPGESHCLFCVSAPAATIDSATSAM